VAPITYSVRKGEIVVPAGERIDDVTQEKLISLGLLDPQPDFARAAGWFLLAALTVALLLSWLWRFRPEFWHRDSALLLIGILTIVTVAAFKATGDRSVLPYFVPAAAVGLLLTILLDSGVAILVMGVLAIVGGAIVGTLDFATYVFLGSMAGITIIRRGERASNFVQAGIAMALVNTIVVSVFALLGERDVTGLVQLIGAGLLAAAGSAVAAFGTFAILGNIFGITTSFQLLETGQPVAAAAAAAATRDAGHLPPLTDGGQPGRAGRRCHRRGCAADTRRGLLPRRGQAQQPARLHREPGRHGKHS
jgi:membrane-associated HD superfamily phosphohydrolase